MVVPAQDGTGGIIMMVGDMHGVTPWGITKNGSGINTHKLLK